MWDVIDWWVCVEVANGILWWGLTPRLTCTVLHASFNAWIMVIECSEVGYKCFQFLTTTSISPPFTHLPLSHLFLSSIHTPSYVVYFISNEVGVDLYQFDCRGGCLIEGRLKNCFNALQMMGQLRMANDCRKIPDIWSTLCAAEHNDCFHFAFPELCHWWKELYYAKIVLTSTTSTMLLDLAYSTYDIPKLYLYIRLFPVS